MGGFDTYTIPSGDYRYESITIDGQAALTIDSNSRIYVHNDFTVGGQATVFSNENIEIFIAGNGDFAGQGIVNTSSIPSNLMIYGVGSGNTLSFTGLNDFYGTFYAPESSIYMAGNADCFGSLIGGSVELAGNIEFHFDESLLHDGPFVGYDIAYWQED